MFRIIITVSITLFVSDFILSQTQSEFASTLLEFEKAYFYEKDTIQKNEVLYRKLNFMIKNEISIHSFILNDVKRIDFEYLQDSLKTKFFWNASIIAYLNDDFNYSLFYLKKFEEYSITDSINIELLILKTILYSNYDENIALTSFQQLVELDRNMNCLECLLHLNEYELKHKKFYGISSLLIPGIYSFKDGKFFKGITSLGLNVGTVFVIRNFYKQSLYVNMLTWGSNLFIKFYLGNRTLLQKQLTYSEAKEKEKRTINCTLQLNSILEKYPLIFSF